MTGANQLGYLVKRLQQALRNAMDQGLADVDLTTAQYAVLYNLEQHPKASNAELARLCFVTPQTMIRIVAGLERRRLLRRAPSPTHAAVLQAHLTRPGAAALRSAQRVVDGILATMLAGAPEVEIDNLIASFTEMATRLEQHRHMMRG